jgi:hypothetical protein
MVMSPKNAAEAILRTLERSPSTNETGRRTLFTGYFRELFPKFAWQLKEYALGAERKVRIPLLSEKDVVVGRIDTKKGSLLIEYKTRVKSVSEQEEAELQLRKYVAGIINEEGLIAAVTKGISTDIINWYEYRIKVKSNIQPNVVKPDDIVLYEKRSYSFSSKNPKKFFETVERLVFEEVPIVARAEIILNEFGLESSTYKDFQKELKRIWLSIRHHSEVKLGLNLWSRFIENCFDQSAKPDEDSYIDHAYLVILSRLVAGHAISNTQEQADPNFPASCITGDFFQTGAHRVENFVEDDFFRWIKREDVLDLLKPKLETIHRKLEWLDFRSAKRLDLLSVLYAEIMPPEHKAEYGEVFTPSWLVNMIVDNLEDVEKEGFRFLDPACGTGSFLRSVLAKKLEHLKGKNSPPVDLERILGEICGLDINPISVIIAKTTIMLALSELLKSSTKPVELPIYLCDSLFLPDLRITSKAEGTIIDLDSEEIRLPTKMFSEGTNFFDSLVHIVSSLATDACMKIISKKSGKTKLKERVKDALATLDLTDDELKLGIAGMEKIFDVLIDRIQRKRNNVWAFVLKNTYRPSMLHENFDLIASNPPWLAMSSFPSAKYKKELQSLIDEHNLTPKGASKHHIEISTVYSIYCASRFLKKERRFAYILPRVILNGFQHDPLRKSKFLVKTPLSVDCLWDLDVIPLFKRPACVVYGKKQKGAIGFPNTLPCVHFSGNPDSLESEDKKLTLTTLGNKSSYSYSKEVYYEASTKYKRGFKQGADLMPRRTVIVDIQNGIKSPVLSIETSEAEVNNPNNKKPYNKIFLRGTIERDYIFNTMKSDAVLPFVSGDAVYAALPVRIEKGAYEILEIKDFSEMGHDYAKAWFQKVNKTLTKLSDKNLNVWLRRRNKLIDQSPAPCRFYVLYGAGGTNVTATVIYTKQLNFPFINDQTLYAWRAPSENEAWYICGMLNSAPINEAIKSKQPLGAFGEQHIHELPLLLIPQFDQGISKHIELSYEAQRIHKTASRIVQNDKSLLDPNRPLATRRRCFATKLEPELEKLNSLSKSILEVAADAKS